MLLESDQIKILPDPTTINELEAFGFEISSNGRITYRASAGHDDTVCSLALAVWKLPPKQIKYSKDISYLDTSSTQRYNEWGEPSYV